MSMALTIAIIALVVALVALGLACGALWAIFGGSGRDLG